MKFKNRKLLNTASLYYVILMTTMFFILSCSPSTPPDEVSKIFFKNITYFEHQRAYDFLSKRLKKELSEKNINRETFFGYLKAPIGNPSWIGLHLEIKQNIQKEDKVALISFLLKDMRFQETINGAFELIIEDGLWHVDRLQFDGKKPML
jgi:hypothetical protein